MYTALFAWARKESRQQLFTGAERLVVGVVAALAVVAVIGLAQGFVTV